MLVLSNETMQFRIDTESKKEFTCKANEKYFAPSALLKMFIKKFNDHPTKTLEFLVCG